MKLHMKKIDCKCVQIKMKSKFMTILKAHNTAKKLLSIKYNFAGRVNLERNWA